MKHILLILTVIGLTACSTGIVKNESGVSISVDGNEVENNKCYEWSTFFGVFGSSEVAIKTTGDNPEQIGDKEFYALGYYVVKGVAKDESAVGKMDEAPQCTENPEANLEKAKQAAMDAADAAIATADQKVQAANEEVNQSGPAGHLGNPSDLAAAQAKAEEVKTKADAAKTKAEEAKSEAEAADTMDKANAAKEKAEEAQAEAEAI